MAQIKNFRIPAALNACSILIKRPLPARGALKLRRVVKALSEADKEIQETRQAIVERFAEKDEDDKPLLTEGENGQQVYTIPEPVREECSKELTDLLNDETALVHTLTIEDLPAEIEAELLLDLDAVLVDE